MAIGKTARLAMLLVLVSSCSSYSSNFSCGDSKGANCLPMDRVDSMISSGEIELYTNGVGRCRGRNCHGSSKNEELKELKAAPLNKDEIYFNHGKYTSDNLRVGRKTSGEPAERILIREHRRDPKFDAPNLEIAEV